jgi:hypothetical protein
MLMLKRSFGWGAPTKEFCHSEIIHGCRYQIVLNIFYSGYPICVGYDKSTHYVILAQAGINLTRWMPGQAGHDKDFTVKRSL